MIVRTRHALTPAFREGTQPRGASVMPFTTTEITNHCAEHMLQLREWALQEGQVPSSLKALVAAAIYAAMRCEE